MANLNKLFSDFNDKITLSAAKKESLRNSRNSLRKEIKDWFSEHDKNIPSFCGQGSYAMKTLVFPINGADYDIDDGIYISEYKDVSIYDWPKTSTVHSWIKDAVADKTKAGATDKDTCIRVQYASGYHIDLPAYICKDDVAYLAHKSKGWIISDPKSFKDWFLDYVKDTQWYGEQLRRVVKYLKRWKDYTGNPLKGIEITILATNNFDKYEGRDDKSLRSTVERIIDSLNLDFRCEKPVSPYEDLFEDASENRKNNIISGLKALRTNLNDAIDEEDEKKASEILRDKVFGTDFPLGKETKTEDYSRSSTPGVLRSDGRSA